MIQIGAGFGGARIRAIALIAILAVPLLMAATFSYLRERDTDRGEAQVRVLNIAILAQREYQLKTATAQQVIASLIGFDAARSLNEIIARPEPCNANLAALLARSPGYLNFFVVDRGGNLVCSAAPPAAPVNVTDRDYFQESMRSGTISAGQFTIGRVTGKPAVILAYPIIDSTGVTIGLSAASVDLSSVVMLPDALDLPAGSSVTLLDRTGTVMARNIEPERWVGKPGAELHGLSSDVAAGGTSTAQGRGVDGIQRIYGIARLRAEPSDRIQGSLTVGIPTDTAYGGAEDAFRRNVLVLAAVSLLATSAAWIGTTRLVIDPLRSIAGSVQRIAAGDFSARTGLANERGEIGVLASAIDQMAAQVLATQDELLRDQQEMATILSTTLSVVTIVRADGVITRINKAVERQFGWPPDEMVGRNLNVLLSEPVLPLDDDGPALRSTERLGIARNGDEFPVEIEIRAVEGSRRQRFVAIVRDLTERRRVEAERQRAQVATVRAEFLRTLSHELRSPLTAVLGFAQLLREEATDARARGQAKDIEEAGRYMLTLVTDLLDLARIDAGRWEVTLAPVDVADTLATVVNGIRARAEERGLRLEMDVDGAMGPVRTDARVLREVATNLIENAVKYTPSGAVVARATVADEVLRLEVIDTGVGIPSERFDSIFDEFQQLGLSDSEEGTGLGLAITRKLVQLLGGTISVASTPGAGSVFTALLPVPGERSARITTPEEPSAPGAP